MTWSPFRLGKFSCPLQAICVTLEISRDAVSTGQLDRRNVFDKFCSEIFDASLNKRHRTKLPSFARSSSPGIEKRWSRTSPVNVGRVQLVRKFNVVGFENFGFGMFAYMYPYAKPQFEYRSANIELYSVCSSGANR
jgi:hypothetical protein